MRQFLQLLLIHLREFYREPAIIFWSLFFPAALAIGLGFAFRGPTNATIDIGVLVLPAQSDSKQPASALLKRIEKLDRFQIHELAEAQAVQELKRGKLRILLQIDGNHITFLYDPQSDAAMKEAALLKAALLGSEVSESKNKKIQFSETSLNIPGTRYIDYLIPGLLSLGVLNACLWGIGWSLISMRMKKLLRRMAATPMNPNWFFLSFTIARIALVTVEAGFLMLVGYWVFDLKPAASIVSLIIMFLAGIVCFGGLAVLVGSHTENTQVGNGLINAASMPMMLFSGIFFSYHGFPEAIQPLIKVLPLTIFADAIRSMYLEGTGLTDLWLSIVSLVVMGVVFFVTGRRFFKWS